MESKKKNLETPLKIKNRALPPSQTLESEIDSIKTAVVTNARVNERIIAGAVASNGPLMRCDCATPYVPSSLRQPQADKPQPTAGQPRAVPYRSVVRHAPGRRHPDRPCARPAVPLRLPHICWVPGSGSRTPSGSGCVHLDPCTAHVHSSDP
jgi:hypothetical protein